MNAQNKSLFKTAEPLELGLGYHNIGNGLLRYAHENLIREKDFHYGQRCGHIPLNAKTIGVLVEKKDEEIVTQMAYLSSLYGRELKIISPEEVKKYAKKQAPLIIPYMNVPETESFINERGAHSWGLPGKMTHVLKNKAEFHSLIDKVTVEGFQAPEYTVVHFNELIPKTTDFLNTIEKMYQKYGVNNDYPLGVMLRVSDEEGNFCSAVMYEKPQGIIVIPDGIIENAKICATWKEALATSKKAIGKYINLKKDALVVLTRYIDSRDSPGMSLVILEGKTYSLGWNGQLQLKGTACLGTHSFTPKSSYLKQMQNEYEDHTAEIFTKFLKKTAEQCSLDFNAIRGIANVDMLIPSDLEKHLQKKRGVNHQIFYTECNARWTNYTDAISAVIGIERREQTVDEMIRVIQNGIWTYDKYKLPKNVNPKIVRELIFEKDQQLQKEGTRIICRMAKNPMGLIFVGDFKRAEQAMRDIVASIK